MFTSARTGEPMVRRRPEQWQVNRVREAVRTLNEQLFKAKFGYAPEPWDGCDTKALDTYLQCCSPFPTVAEVEAMVRSHFESDGINPERPYLWLAHFGKYIYGPMDARGEPKRAIARMEEEINRRNSEILAEEAQRATDKRDADAKYALESAIAKVTEDLLLMGFEVFRVVSPRHTCHLLATMNARAKNENALRIVVRTGNNVTSSAAFYQAVVSQGPNQTIEYTPPL